MRVFDNYFASRHFGLEHCEGLMEAPVASGLVIEGEDVDVVEKIVAAKRVLDLHE